MSKSLLLTLIPTKPVPSALHQISFQIKFREKTLTMPKYFY